MKKAVVTYNFGNYDVMPNPIWRQNDWDLFCFTDEDTTHIPKEFHKLVLKSTDIPHIVDASMQPKRLSNYIKYQPFSLLKEAIGHEYDTIAVIDANFTIANDLDEACERLLMATMDGCFMNHPTVKSCYDDIDLAVKTGKIYEDIANFSKKYFAEINAPAHDSSYCQTGVSIRRNTSGWRHFETIWWDAYNQVSMRDQPAFNALLTKYPVLDINVVPKAEIDAYFKYNKHAFEKVT